MSEVKNIKVVATARGFAEQLREPGDEFWMPAGSKATWFHAVNPKDDEVKKPAPAKAPAGKGAPGAPATGNDASLA